MENWEILVKTGRQGNQETSGKIDRVGISAGVLSNTCSRLKKEALTLCLMVLLLLYMFVSQVGYSGINVTGGLTYFLGLKFSTPARIFLGSNFRQANSSYAIQAKFPARSESMIKKISSLVFFWVHNIRSMYFFECKILGSVGPPPAPHHVYTRVPPLGFVWVHIHVHVQYKPCTVILSTSCGPFPSLLRDTQE